MSLVSSPLGRAGRAASIGPLNVSDDHRRNHPRLRLGIPARLETLDGTRDVRLIDLSQTGAQIDCAWAQAIGQAVLQWLDFETFGETVWRDGELLGVRFDRPLSPSVIFATRQMAPSIVANAHHAASAAAREWVQGNFRSGTEA